MDFMVCIARGLLSRRLAVACVLGRAVLGCAHLNMGLHCSLAVFASVIAGLPPWASSNGLQQC